MLEHLQCKLGASELEDKEGQLDPDKGSRIKTD